jgi:hypothetical protein
MNARVRFADLVAGMVALNADEAAWELADAALDLYEAHPAADKLARLAGHPCRHVRRLARACSDCAAAVAGVDMVAPDRAGRYDPGYGDSCQRLMRDGLAYGRALRLGCPCCHGLDRLRKLLTETIPDYATAEDRQ